MNKSMERMKIQKLVKSQFAFSQNLFLEVVAFEAVKSSVSVL